MKISLASAFFLVSFSQISLGNLMDCKKQGILVTKCRLVSKEISTPLSDPAFGLYETQFHVKFIFNCPGQKPKLGFKSGADQSFVDIKTNQDIQNTNIVGNQPLTTHDPDPDATHGLTFHRECSLIVKSVKRLPSLAETLKWREDAEQQHKILRLAYNVYLIIVNMEEISQWDKDQIAAVSHAISAIIEDRILKHGIVAEAAKPKDAFVSPKKYLQNLQAADPDISDDELQEHQDRYLAFLGGDTLDLITLLYFTDSIVKNRPVGTNPTIGDAVKASKKATSLREKAKNELIKEHQLAIAMIDRAKKYKVDILKELEVLSDKIETSP